MINQVGPTKTDMSVADPVTGTWSDDAPLSLSKIPRPSANQL